MGFINRLSVAGITLGIAALIIVLSVMNGLESQLKSRILGVLPHVAVEQPVSSPMFNVTKLPEQILHKSSYLESEAILQSVGELRGILVQGILPEDKFYQDIEDKMMQGSLTRLVAGEYHIFISQSLARQLGVNVGSQLRVISPQASSYSPFGRIPSQRLFTVAGTFQLMSDIDDKVAFVHITDLAKLNRVRSAEGYATRLFLSDAFDIDNVIPWLDAQNTAYNTWRERQGPLFDAVKMEKNMMALMLTLVILVAGFNVIAALVMVVAEKAPDIAILLTQGMRPGDIKSIFIFNGIYNAILGSLFGIVIGVSGTLSLNWVLASIGINMGFGENGQSLPTDIQLSQVVVIAISTLVLCAAAAWYPATKAAQILPADGLREE